MITHEEIRKLLNTTEMGESTTRLYERKLKIHDYVSQQENKDRLLELYRHIYFHDKMMSEEEFYETLYKIKALEEEMK